MARCTIESVAVAVFIPKSFGRARGQLVNERTKTMAVFHRAISAFDRLFAPALDIYFDANCQGMHTRVMSIYGLCYLPATDRRSISHKYSSNVIGN